MGAVWDLDLPATDKFVLLAFADHADHNGENARPGIALVAKKCSLSERQVQVSISKLKSAGYMVPHAHEAGGRSNVTSFRICFPKGEATAPITTIKGEATAPITTIKGEATAPITTIKGEAGSLKGEAGSLKGADDAVSPNRNGRAEPSGTVIEPAAATREAAAADSPSDSEHDIPRGIFSDEAEPIPLLDLPEPEVLAMARSRPGDLVRRFRREFAAVRDPNGKPYAALMQDKAANARSPNLVQAKCIVEDWLPDLRDAMKQLAMPAETSRVTRPSNTDPNLAEFLAMQKRAEHDNPTNAANAVGETIQ